MAETITDIAHAMYLKEKDSLDRKFAKDIQTWADKCRSRNMLSSSIFIQGVWEREEERALKLCRYFWECLMELMIKHKGTLTAEDQAEVRAGAKEIIENELGQSKNVTLDWVRRSIKGQEPYFLRQHELAENNFLTDLERELTIRKGLAEVGTTKTTPVELPRSAIVQKDFSFISSDDLRKICERDYEEIQRVQIAGAHKATVVMSGSLTEALLLDALQKDEAKARVSSKAPSKPLTQWDLHELLEVAVDLGLVNAGASVLVKAIKDYRNLIHPGREVRTKFHVGAEEAAISRQFLDLVIRDLSGGA